MLPLPPNVRRATHVTLEDVVHRLSRHVRVNLTRHWRSWPVRESDLATSLPYKISCDAKPLFPLLYPEIFLESGVHQWLGYVDNDVLLGGTAFSQLLDAVRGCSAGVLPTLGEEQLMGTARPALAFGPLTIFNTVSRAHRPSLFARALCLQPAFAIGAPAARVAAT